MDGWMDSTLLVILCSALITPLNTAWGANETLWHPVTFCTWWGHRLFLGAGRVVSRTGSTHPPRPCKVKVSVRSQASRGVGRPGALAGLWLKIPGTALLTQHKNVDSRGTAAAPTVIKITDSTRLNSSFFRAFFFFLCEAHGRTFLASSLHWATPQICRAAARRFHPQRWPALGNQLKTKTPRLIVLPQSTVAFVFCLFAAKSCTAMFNYPFLFFFFYYFYLTVTLNAWTAFYHTLTECTPTALMPDENVVANVGSRTSRPPIWSSLDVWSVHRLTLNFLDRFTRLCTDNINL